ncbi:MAG: hypothetical protein R3B84_05300 [Zavarzinella sp.]
MKSTLPAHLIELLDNSLHGLENHDHSGELRHFAKTLYQAAYQFRFQYRTADDNRLEHELIVLENAIRIGLKVGANLESPTPRTVGDFQVLIISALLHDLRFIRRITEQDLRYVKEHGSDSEYQKLVMERSQQRLSHMRGSAADAKIVLKTLAYPLEQQVIRQSIGYIHLHDLWKTGVPYPLASDGLAVCFFEADALWPLHPHYGPLADLERQGIPAPDFDQLRQQAIENYHLQLCAGRKLFEHTAEQFQDDKTIIRTSEGQRILREYCTYWGII